MTAEGGSRRIWGKPWVTVLVLLAIALLAGVGSALAEPQDLPQSLRLDSGWIFHVVFGMVGFIVLYGFAALLTFTLESGVPLAKMGVGQFSFEASTKGVISEGAAIADGINSELESLNKTVDTIVQISSESERAIAAFSKKIPDAGAHPDTEFEARAQRLDALRHKADQSRKATSDAVNRFRLKLNELESLVGEQND